jgi:hypothetical protein
MEEIVPGYNEARESLLAKIQEPMEMYLLCKLKIAQFRAGQIRHPAIERELKESLMIHALEIDKVLLKDIENQ